MATTNVNPVNVTIQTQTLTSKDLDQDDKNKKRKTTSAFDVSGDSVDVGSTTTNVSTVAEAKAPSPRTAHDRVKAQRSALEGVLKKAGVELKPGEDLVLKAKTVLDDVEAKITTFLEKGGKGIEVETLYSQKDSIIESLGAYEAIRAEAVDSTQTVQSASATDQADVPAGTLTPEEAKVLWTTLDKDLKTLRLNVDMGELDVTFVQNKVVAQVTKQLDELVARENELKASKAALETQIKTASPEDQKRIQAEIKTAENDLTNVRQQQKECRVAFVKVNEALAHFQAAKDLGISFTNKSETRSAAVKTSSVTPPPSSKTTTRSATVKTSSAGGSAPASNTGGPAPTSSGFTLSTASAGSTTPGAGAALTTDESLVGGALLGTASADGGDAAPLTGNDLLSTSAYAELQSSLSGTTLAIASTSSAVQADGRRTEAAIEKLLRAAAAGNYEAIKTALIMLDKRASQTVIGMGSATIKAMQNYEEQMSTLSKSLDSLKTDDPSYNAKLAQVNSEMNTYSMNRQAIANFLQQVMTSREEIGNTTHGFISKDGQIGSALSRW